jgi:hypothetical protein
MLSAPMHRSRTAAASVALLVLFAPSRARADGEAWQQFEYRAPIVQTERPEFPRVAWRVYAEAREAGRFSGLYDSFFRTGPMLWVTRWLFVATHATFEGTRTAAGCATPAVSSCGQYVFEFRAELEPNLFGRIGPFTFNDRNRVEYRWRESGAKWRYRNQLRINFQPIHWRIWPWAMNEWLFDLSADEASHAFHQNRLQVGVAFQLNPYTRLDLSYMLRSRGGATANDPSWHFEHDHIGVALLVVDVPPFVATPASQPSSQSVPSNAPLGSAPPSGSPPR